MSKSRIHTLIPKVIKDLGPIDKKGWNEDDQYAFRLIDEVCQKIQPLFVKHNVFCVPELLDSREENLGDEGVRVVVKVRYKLFASDGSAFEATVPGEAIDDSDKALKKAMTAAFKTMITQVFCLAVGVKGLDTAATSPRLNFVDGKPPARRPAPSPRSSRSSISRGTRGAKMADMKVPDGRFKGKMLSRIPRRELQEYFEQVESAMAQSGKRPPKWFYDMKKASGL